MVHFNFISRIRFSVCADLDFLWSDMFMGQSGIKGVLLDVREDKTFKY